MTVPATVRVPAYGPPDPVALLRASVDHLYPDCPLLRRICRGREPRLLKGIALVQGGRTEEWGGDGLVDPLGTDICGLCQRWWRARHREAVGA
jgi:hypothetical protein